MKATEKFVTIKRLGFQDSAEFYKARLSASEIECYIMNSTSVLPIDAGPMGGILLKVREVDAAMATDIINELDKDYLNAKKSEEHA